MSAPLLTVQKRLNHNMNLGKWTEEVGRTLRISSEHRRDWGSREQCHRIGARAVQLAVLAALTTRPGGTDNENVTLGGGGLGLVAARDVHWLASLLVQRRKD